MRKSLPLLLLIPMALGANAQYEAQEDPVPFDVTLRIGAAEPRSIDREVAPGMREIVELGGGLQLEMSAPADPLDYVMLRLLKRQGELPLPLHTARYPLREAVAPRAYLVCGELATYFEQAIGELPECPGSS